MPYAEMSSNPVRRELDSGLAAMLGAPDFSTLRVLLGQEPIVTAKSLWREAEVEEGVPVVDQLVLFGT